MRHCIALRAITSPRQNPNTIVHEAELWASSPAYTNVLTSTPRPVTEGVDAPAPNKLSTHCLCSPPAISHQSCHISPLPVTRDWVSRDCLTLLCRHPMPKRGWLGWLVEGTLNQQKTDGVSQAPAIWWHHSTSVTVASRVHLDLGLSV
jgi:hypothetical protein